MAGDPVLISRWPPSWARGWRPPIDLDLRPIERDARGVDELLPLGFAALTFCTFRLIVVPILRSFADYGIRRHAYHAAVQQPVAGKVERVDLDLGFLTRVYESDAPVRDHRFHFDTH